MQAVVAIWSGRPRAFNDLHVHTIRLVAGPALGGARAGGGVRVQPGAARRTHGLARGHPGRGGAVPHAGGVDRRRRLPARPRPALRGHLRPLAPARGLPAGRFPRTHHGRHRGARRQPVHLRANLRALAGETVTYEWTRPSRRGIRHMQTTLSPLRGAARRGGGHRGRRARHHPANRGRAADPPGAEDGRGGPVRGRRRPRPQQHDDDHHRLQRLPARRARAGRPPPGRRRRDPEGRRARDAPHPAAPRLRPAPGRRARGAEPQRGGRGHGADAPAAPGRGHHPGHESEPGPGRRRGRLRPDGAGGHEPHPQRARRDAARRRAHHRDDGRRVSGGVCLPAPGCGHSGRGRTCCWS